MLFGDLNDHAFEDLAFGRASKAFLVKAIHGFRFRIVIGLNVGAVLLILKVFG
jgi:hypothetical protein